MDKSKEKFLRLCLGIVVFFLVVFGALAGREVLKTGHLDVKMILPSIFLAIIAFIISMQRAKEAKLNAQPEK